MRNVLVFFSDSHAGHRLGLLNPDVVLYDEDEEGNYSPWTPTLTAVQSYLWRDLYLPALSELESFADDDPVHVFHVGDLTQGKAYTDHLVSTRMADQILIAVANMQPLFKTALNLQTFRLVAGTGSHVFREGSSTGLVTDRLRAEHKGVDIQQVRHGAATVDGLRIDYAHHGPSAGIREWTEGNQLRYYAKSVVIGDVLRDKPPPRLIVRGHFHEWAREIIRVAKRYVADIFLLPSLCGMGEYGRQATGSKAYISNGIVAVAVQDGRLAQVLPLVKEVDLRTEEVIS